MQERNDVLQLFNEIQTRAIVRSDGFGNVTEIIENHDMDADSVAEGIDIALASLQEFAQSQDLGAVLVTMQMCDRGTVFSGKEFERGALTVVTAPDASVGMILSIMRRIAQGSGEQK